MKQLLVLIGLFCVISIGQSQNIGLHKTNPQRDIDAEGTMRITKSSSGSLPQLDLLETGGLTSFTRIRLSNELNAKHWIIASRPQDTMTNVTGRFNIFNSETGNLLSISDKGLTGIATSSPSDMLHINGTNGSNLLRVQNNGVTRFRIFSNNSVAFGTNNQNVSDNDVYFHHQVGIGVSSPSARLDVAGTVKTEGLQVTTGAGSGRVLTSNSSGVATWQVPQSDDLGSHKAQMDLNLDGYRIFNLEAPSNDNDAANKQYVDDHEDGDASATNEKINIFQRAGTSLQIREGNSALVTADLSYFYSLGDHTAQTTLNMTNNIVRNVGTPILANDAATKGYVDSQLGSSGGSGIADNDGNTSIEVNNNDEILFEVNGEQVGMLNETSLELGFGDHNSICIGENAGSSLNSTFIGNNVAIGFDALSSATSGNGNVAVGQLALSSSINTGGNTAVGSAALRNTTAGANTAVGGSAMINNTTGTRNTVVGSAAMSAPSDRSDCVVIGANAHNNVGSDEVVAVGSDAMRFGRGTGSVAMGFQAKYRNIGTHSVAIGHRAIGSNTTGTASHTIAIGADAAFAVRDGDNNIAMGTRAMETNVFGDNNIAIGYESLTNVNGGDGHTVMGYRAGNGLTGGQFCTVIGHQALQSVAGGAQINSTSIGNGASHQASNSIRLGNTAVSSIGGYANWSNVSDQRFKTNVQEDVPGLAFVESLRPVTYNLDLHAIDDWHADKLGWRDSTLAVIGYDKEQIVYSGFLAQEVEAAATSLGYDFSGVDGPANETDFYGLRYAEFVVPLTKAVQELSSQLKIEQEKNEQLQARLLAFEDRLATLEAASGGDK